MIREFRFSVQRSYRFSNIFFLNVRRYVVSTSGFSYFYICAAQCALVQPIVIYLTACAMCNVHAHGWWLLSSQLYHLQSTQTPHSCRLKLECVFTCTSFQRIIWLVSIEWLRKEINEFSDRLMSSVLLLTSKKISFILRASMSVLSNLQVFTCVKLQRIFSFYNTNAVIVCDWVISL